MSEEQTASFAWTATTGYEHFPQFVNLTGNRLAIRGAEVFNGRHYEHGPYVAVELPPEAIAELGAAFAHAGLRETLERFRYCMDPGFPDNGSILVPTKDLRALIRALRVSAIRRVSGL